jgi:hypothetical protein
MTRAPTNFPYTATSYLTGSTTSIIAGYIGMRIAVYTNTRVTFTCAESCHRGFVTAFRGGQVLGFVLVGLAILNIMIIILIFKACWYNEFLNEALQAGMPIDNCPVGSHAGMVTAQAQIWKFFEAETYKQWVTGYNAAHPVVTTVATAAKVVAPVDHTAEFKASSKYWTHAGVEDNLCSLWTATTTNLKHKFSYAADANVDEILFKGGFKDGDAMPNCLRFTWSAASGQYNVSTKNWGDAMTDYETMGFSATPRETSDWSQTGATNDLLKHEDLKRGEVFSDSFPNVPIVGTASEMIANSIPRSSWIWSDEDQLDCMDAYNTAFYTFKQRICVLTRRMFELVAGYGLGGSSVALFGRVGGGIYTKAADVGADLVGKTLKDLKEDDITNPGTIADNVGDNVGDIAGMGSDLFGSLAESTCAALVVSATSYELVSHPNALFFPVAVTASGTVASWFSVLLAHVRTVEIKNVQSVLKF